MDEIREVAKIPATGGGYLLRKRGVNLFHGYSNL